MKDKLFAECFDYDAENGVLKWRKRPIHHFKNEHSMNIWNARYAGQKAGTDYKPSIDSDYVRTKVVINNIQYKAHQIAWILSNGEIPDGFYIDHIDGVATNNALKNLRLVTHSMNHRNRRIQSNNTSGVTGVRFSKGKWNARVKINGKEKSLGTFENKEDAIRARIEYATKHGFTERHHTDRGLGANDICPMV